MKNLKYHFKRNKFRSYSDRSYKKNGKSHNFESDLSNINDFQRKRINKNFNASKLIEKYTELDHFVRVSEEKNLKVDKSLYNNQNTEKSNKDDPKINSK